MYVFNVSLNGYKTTYGTDIAKMNIKCRISNLPSLCFSKNYTYVNRLSITAAIRIVLHTLEA